MSSPQNQHNVLIAVCAQGYCINSHTEPPPGLLFTSIDELLDWLADNLAVPTKAAFKDDAEILANDGLAAMAGDQHNE